METCVVKVAEVTYHSIDFLRKCCLSQFFCEYPFAHNSCHFSDRT